MTKQEAYCCFPS